MTRVLVGYKPTTSVLNPCSCWLMKMTGYVMLEWAVHVANLSLQDCYMPSLVKETIVRPIPKSLNVAADDLSSYRLVINIHFMSRLIELVMGK